jgi:aerobic carbon-monoxide dehydrogenase medium subunit
VKPAPFHYARPGTVIEAVGLLAASGASARLLAGGQSLVPLLTRRIERPELLIDINRIAGLDQIEICSTHIRMGALVRQEQALRSAIVREQVAGLAEALTYVANPVVRRRGTVVGNLVTNSPGAELPAVALALGAQFVVRDPECEQTVSAATLLGHERKVPDNAIITHVLWPRRGGAAGFYEVARRHGHAPVVSAMVSMSDGDCRVAVSGVCAFGLSCPTMAEVIGRHFPRPPDLRRLASALRDDATGPLYGDVYSSARYRLDVAPEISRRAAQLMALRAAA